MGERELSWERTFNRIKLRVEELTKDREFQIGGECNEIAR